MFTRKYCFKLQDSSVFTSGKDGMPVVEWLAKMKQKIEANNNLIDIP